MNLFRLLLWPLRRPAPAPAPVAGPLTLEQYQALEPNMSVREGETSVIFATPNVATRFRVDTLHSKEPDTIAWIAGFKADDVLIDIGANVGMYTIWAAKTRGMRVYAFEPESQNYALLCKNIVLNDLSGQVVAYCVALSDESAFSLLYLSDFHAGGSCHTFGEKLDHRLEHRDSKYAQGCVSATLDQLVETGVVPMPNHIKVDVDGLEHRVIRGCAKVMADPRLKSVLVEINTNLELHRNIIRDMQALGFAYSTSQVAQALRTEGVFAGVGNHIFHR
jgi:FkbM family methyltransferase